jgi:hypothetical protein
VALNRGFLVKKITPRAEIDEFLRRFRENYISVDLIRIGGPSDGGYLVPDVMHGITHCFSPGVDFTAEFEKELSTRYGIASFMADASVPGVPIHDERFKFTKKFLGSKQSEDFITLSDWIDDNVSQSETNLLLQMDIEGGEYDVLLSESDQTLGRFSIMVIEFHHVQNVFDTWFMEMFRIVFEKIFRNFVVCHAHPNNGGGIARRGDLEVPRIMEITFLRRDLAGKLGRQVPIGLPHPLDSQNVDTEADVVMPHSWWRKT